MPKLNGYVWSDYNLYRAVRGDSWDWIAHQAYGNAALSPILLYANPALTGLLVLEGGEIITIPIIDAAASVLLPPWRGGRA